MRAKRYNELLHQQDMIKEQDERNEEQKKIKTKKIDLEDEIHKDTETHTQDEGQIVRDPVKDMQLEKITRDDQMWNHLFSKIPKKHRPIVAQKWYRDLLRFAGLEEGVSAGFPSAQEQYNITIRRSRALEFEEQASNIKNNSPDVNIGSRKLQLQKKLKYQHSSPHLEKIRDFLETHAVKSISTTKRLLEPINDVYTNIKQKQEEKRLKNLPLFEQDDQLQQHRMDTYNPFDPASPLPKLPLAYMIYECRQTLSKYLPILLLWLIIYR